MKLERLLLVGGNTRHIGKTTLICELIRKFSPLYPVTGLKVTSIYQNDALHHGSHDLLAGKDFEIAQEQAKTKGKDTAKMLACGAGQAFYVQARDHAVEKAWKALLQHLPENTLLICESRTLRRFIQPGVFIYLKSSRIETEKPLSAFLEKSADLVITDPNPQDLASLAERIEVQYAACFKLFK